MNKKFRTELTPKRSDFEIDLARKIFSAGSCFADNIAERLRRSKFVVEGNPFGVMFNPASIAGMLTDLAEGRRYKAKDLATDGDLSFGWSFHGDFSDRDAALVLARMNDAVVRGRNALLAADCVILTFGSAWVYELADGGDVVANCHKRPASMFRRRRLSVEEIVKMYEPLLGEGGVLNGKRVILTVSPVRHLKDGFEENSLSKAILRVAVGELCDRWESVEYFPAFEMVTDDLRDYRFYAEDMAHPSELAVDYVWDKFCLTYMSEATMEFISRVEKVRAAMQHRLLHPESEAATKFRASQYECVKQLATEYPDVDFDDELHYFAPIID